MPEQKKPHEKKISLAPLTFEEALKKAVNVPPLAKAKSEKKALAKRQRGKTTESKHQE